MGSKSLREPTIRSLFVASFVVGGGLFTGGFFALGTIVWGGRLIAWIGRMVLG